MRKKAKSKKCAQTSTRGSRAAPQSLRATSHCGRRPLAGGRTLATTLGYAPLANVSDDIWSAPPAGCGTIGSSCRIFAPPARNRSLPIYDLAAVGRALTREDTGTPGKISLALSRSAAIAARIVAPVSLGEGGTPLLRAERFGAASACRIFGSRMNAHNPTQSFKARGMAVAVSMAKYLGATKLAVPTAGNAGGALAAYAARAGLEAHIFMPADTPRGDSRRIFSCLTTLRGRT